MLVGVRWKPGTQVSVRAATIDDAAALAELRVAGDTVYARRFATWMAAHASTHLPFVAVEGTDVIGVAWLALAERVPSPDRPLRRCGDVQSVHVRPDRRDRGVGAALVAAVLAEARKLGLEHVTVHSSPRAVRLYERAGFGHDPQWLSIVTLD
jgi:GNAT superfamily N-acetyltransferase